MDLLQDQRLGAEEWRCAGDARPRLHSQRLLAVALLVHVVDVSVGGGESGGRRILDRSDVHALDRYMRNLLLRKMATIDSIPSSVVV